MGGARGRVRKNKRSPKQTTPLVSSEEAQKRLPVIEKQIRKSGRQVKKAVDYLEKALDKALDEEGNDVQVARLLKWVEERLQGFHAAAAELRVAASSGLATRSERGPVDFEDLMATRGKAEGP